ncbi:Uracil-DNA glycosylase [Aphelenchoides bicaudatus]|nr:Uracil-DNA glycosylase [Aphelenchoides bicaudatus]
MPKLRYDLLFSGTYKCQPGSFHIVRLKRLIPVFDPMSANRKRPLKGSENTTPTNLKQSKLSFGPAKKLTLGISPANEKPKAVNPDGFFNHAIAPLKGTTWYDELQPEFKKPYMQQIFTRLGKEAKEGQTIYPPINLIFNAFRLTPFEKVRVVILGQDPYHNVGQAHGLSFSVPMGVKQPPSLKNIFKELSKEYPKFRIPDHGCLVKWAEQGVFMLNATLTVQKDKANSHSNIGWQTFTDTVIKMINRDLTGVVFLLWGNFAQKKAVFVDTSKHAVIKTGHPSPLSYRFFEDSNCFTATNEALRKMNRKEIDWSNV